MSDSVWPHRWQSTRLRRPWDSPGKNTGVGCHFLLQCMKVRSESEVSQLRPHGLQPTRLLCPWDFPGKSTGVECHCLLLKHHWHTKNTFIKFLDFRIVTTKTGSVQSVSHVWLFVTPWTVAGQAPLSMESSRQEYWRELHSLLLGIFLTQGLNLGFLNCRWFHYHLSHQGSTGICQIKAMFSVTFFI